MGEIEQTQLPGMGVRFDFNTDDGMRIGVVHHRSGRREVFVCTAGDPDSAIVTLDLTDDEVHNLVDVLGGSQIVENMARLQRVEGLAIDWISVAPGTPYGGRTIGDARIRTRTGVSVVAVIRGDTPHPAPGPEFGIEPDDVLVVVGTATGIAMVTDILQSG